MTPSTIDRDIAIGERLPVTETFTICRVIGPEALRVVSKHERLEEAESAMLALGERYPCGGERHLIFVDLPEAMR